jgi:hypothetical protein
MMICTQEVPSEELSEVAASLAVRTTAAVTPKIRTHPNAKAMPFLALFLDNRIRMIAMMGIGLIATPIAF